MPRDEAGLAGPCVELHVKQQLSGCPASAVPSSAPLWSARLNEAAIDALQTRSRCQVQRTSSQQPTACAAPRGRHEAGRVRSPTVAAPPSSAAIIRHGPSPGGGHPVGGLPPGSSDDVEDGGGETSRLKSPSISKELRHHGHAHPIVEDAATTVLTRPAIIAGACWITCSAGVLLLNKQVLSRYNFTAVYSLLAYHCLIAVALLRAADAAGVVEIVPLTRDVALTWAPLNCLFVAMLATAYKALGLLGVGILSVLKNLTNIVIVAGDRWMLGRTYTWHVYACLGLMLATAMMGAANDRAFSPTGYAWQLLNCVLTAGYALYLSRVTQRLASSGGAACGRRISEASMAYYNNLLSLPLALVLAVVWESWGFAQQPALRDASFQIFAFLGGVLGLGVSFCSIWFMSASSATLYTLTGSMNKFLVAAVGVWAFGESKEPRYIASIVVGLAAGGLLPFIKMKQPPASAGGGK